ncbi:peptidyl-prolyl cis-trans isomerase [Methylobacterium sp. NFXW15]|uniref:peptidylprolyl isomerase n=1 Tax=Methylobacterium sp. NFXW15 TaxID=2819512 RepID=UPI003CEF5525
MLQGIRAASEHWLGKIVLAIIFSLLMFGIGIYGVEDLVRGGGTSAVATVGDTKISAEKVRQSYQNQLERYQVQLKRALSPEQARSLGLDRQVMSQLITEAALDQKTRDLGLAVPDSTVLRAIREEKSFQNAQGQFEPQLFYQTLQRAGLNEQGFVREQRSVIARIQLAEAVSGGITVPTALREAVHRYSTERRAVSYLFLQPSDAGQIPAPSDEELKTWYDGNKDRFRAPEYRTVNILVVDPEAVAQSEPVSDEDARKAYDLNKSRYGTPEKRTIQQIVFPDAASAEAARKEIEEGAKTFEQVAEARGTSGQELTLGTLSRDELFDKAVGEAAFALPEGGVSQPVKGQFGQVLLRVTKIEPGTVKSFDEVSGEIRKTLALQRAKDKIEDVRDAIEDQRASAKPLADIAAERKLALVAVQAVDGQGKAPDGNRVAGIPDADTTLPAIFRAEIGGDNEPLRTKSGGFIWYDVTKIDAAHDKPFDEVKDAVKAGWVTAETAKRLQTKGRELVEKLDKGASIEDVAKEVGVNPQETSDLARNQPKDMLTSDVVNLIFATPVEKSGSAASGDTRAVFKVTSASVPAFVPDSPSDRTVTQNFQSAIADDVLSQYIADVQKNAGVKVDQAALRKVFGGEY